MTITSQQIDAWDAEVDAAYAAGRQEGMKQERALWELSRLGQEIEAQPEQCEYCKRGLKAGLCTCKLAQPEQRLKQVAHVYLLDAKGWPKVGWDDGRGIKVGDKLYIITEST